MLFLHRSGCFYSHNYYIPRMVARLPTREGDKSARTWPLPVSVVAANMGAADASADGTEEALLKTILAREIGAIIKRRRMTQMRAAELLRLRQPDVSAIVTGRTEKFSVGRLLRCLDRLDHRVHVEVRPKPVAERRLPSMP